MKKVTICIQNNKLNLSSSFDVSDELDENSSGIFRSEYENLLIYITTQITTNVTIKHQLFDLNKIIFFLDSKIDYDKLKEHLKKITQW